MCLPGFQVSYFIYLIIIFFTQGKEGILQWGWPEIKIFSLIVCIVEVVFMMLFALKIKEMEEVEKKMEDELLHQEMAQFSLMNRKRRGPDQVGHASSIEKQHSGGPAPALLQQGLTKREQLVYLHRQRYGSLAFSLTASFIGTTFITLLQMGDCFVYYLP